MTIAERDTLMAKSKSFFGEIFNLAHEIADDYELTDKRRKERLEARIEKRKENARRKLKLGSGHPKRRVRYWNC